MNRNEFQGTYKLPRTAGGTCKLRQIPSVHGNSPSLFGKQIIVHDGYSFFTVGTAVRSPTEVILSAECQNKTVSLLEIEVTFLAVHLKKNRNFTRDLCRFCHMPVECKC